MCVCVQHCLEQSLRLPRKSKSPNSKRNRGKSETYSTHTFPAARQNVVMSLSLHMVTRKIWGKRLIHGCTLHSTVLEIYLACSATSSINRPSHSNAHRQVPPVQSRILLCAYLSHRWWMLLNAYIKASKNLHSKTKNDWWLKSNISKRYRFLGSVLSFSKPQLNFQKLKISRILMFIT